MQKEVFQLKELEKIAPKEKGIVIQSVKEVLQMLVDDGLVETDKIGTLACFWAFPTKAATTVTPLLVISSIRVFQLILICFKRKNKLNETKNEIESLQAKKDLYQNQLTEALAGKDKSVRYI